MNRSEEIGVDMLSHDFARTAPTPQEVAPRKGLPRYRVVRNGGWKKLVHYWHMRRHRFRLHGS
jgi:hypothetical protein